MITFLASIVTYVIDIDTEIVIIINNIVGIRNSENSTREISISKIIYEIIFLPCNFKFSVNVFIINYSDIINFSVVIGD